MISVRTSSISSRVLLFTFMLLSMASTLNAQTFERIDVPMEVNGSDLDYGFLGGLTNPILSNAYLNDDNIQDLIIFDKNGDRLYTFVHSGQVGEPDFVYAPEYEQYFPRMQGWALFRDYNQDGVIDIFTSSTPNHVVVYKGYRQDGDLRFERKLFPDDPIDVLYFNFMPEASNQRRAIDVAINVDVPAITDVDGDGDLDILSFETGGSFLTFYRNLAIENNLGLDELYFEQGDGCWGKFKEGGLDATITISPNPNNCSTGLFGHEQLSSNRHSGSSVCAFDGDGDGDIDVVLGDIGSDRLVYLNNAGTSDQAYVDKAILDYPTDSPAVQNIFPAAYFVDVDGDNKNDLVVTPTSKESGININHIWYYKNIGTQNHPEFQLTSKNLLLNKTINIGKYTHPAFFDYNADGLMDFIVGSAGYRISSTESELGIHLFENVGTNTEPAYKLVDDDYLGFSELINFSIRLAPTFGDLDNDGDQDLIIGDNHARLYYFENKGGEGNPAVFNGYVYEYSDIDVGNNAKPELFDLNGDGLLDLIIGESNESIQGGIIGNLNYFENKGSEGNPIFESVADSEILGQFDEEGDKNLVPNFILKEDGTPVLFIGTDKGTIREYLADGDAYTLKQDSVGEILIGRNLAFDLADIDDDGFLEMVLGNRRGGVMLYNTPYLIDGTNSPTKEIYQAEISIHPNPVNNLLMVSSNEEIAMVEVYSINGQLLLTEINKTQINVSHLPNGLYLAKVSLNNGLVAFEKIIKK